MGPRCKRFGVDTAHSSFDLDISCFGMMCSDRFSDIERERFVSSRLVCLSPSLTRACKGSGSPPQSEGWLFLTFDVCTREGDTEIVFGTCLSSVR